MRPLIVFCSLIVTFCFSSCAIFVAPSMTGGNNIGYLPRPITADSIYSKIYVSGEYSDFTDNSGDLSYRIGALNVSRGHNLGKFNFGYGLFGFAGSAKYIEDKSYANDLKSFSKSMYGGGIRTVIGIQGLNNGKNFDLRVLNWESAFSLERGDFAHYRDELFTTSSIYSGEKTVYVSNKRDIFTTGLSTEGIFNIKLNKESFRMGYRIFVGYSPTLKNSFKEVGPIDPSPQSKTILILGSFFQFQNFYGNLDLSGEFQSGTKFSLGYSF